MNSDWLLEEPDDTDHDELANWADTRFEDDADSTRKGES